MDAEHQELARRLFVVAAEILEDTHPVAAAGQRPEPTRERCAACAAALETAAHSLSLLARTAALLAEQDSASIADDSAPP